MPRARLPIVALLCVAVASCGSTDRPSSCGDLGRAVVSAGSRYCVYDAVAVRSAGGAITCPADVPTVVVVGDSLVCAASGAPSEASALPPDVCALLADPCGAELTDPDAGSPPDAGIADSAGDPPDAGEPSCPALADRPIVEAGGTISSDETWTCQRTYDVVVPLFVAAGATLTIEAGTVVRASGLGGLFVSTDGRIDAAGTAESPVVMTSRSEPGMRRPGDWVGLYVAGRAPLGDSDVTLTLGDDPRLTFGGTDASHDCGRLRYVRIEFAGQRRSAAVRLGGCGSRTVVDGLQVHQATLDAFELLGGTVDIRRVLVTDPRDRAIYWNRGWRGRGQFIAVRTLASAVDRALLHGRAFDGLLTGGALANVTIVSIGAGRTRAAVALDGGSRTTLSHALFWGSYDSVVDLKDAATVALALLVPPSVDVRQSFFYGLGDDPLAYFGIESGPPDWDDEGFDEAAWIADPSRSNRFGIDPLLAGPDRLGDPDLVPALGSSVASAGPLPGDTFFDAAATYAGAFEPGGADWTEPWAAYPSQ